MTLKIKKASYSQTMSLKFLRKFIVFIHHRSNSKHVIYLIGFYTSVYISESFTLNVNFDMNKSELFYKVTTHTHTNMYCICTYRKIYIKMYNLTIVISGK
jgi:hypothetical protein